MAENEEDPITGRKLPRLTNYNDSQSAGPGPAKPLPRLTSYRAPSPLKDSEIGSSGDLHAYDYTASKYDNGNMYAEDLNHLDDIRANNQGTLKALALDVPKFIGKTALNVIGGIAGTVYGVGSAIANGEASKIWDNSLNDKLDELDKGVDDMFKVYKNSDYEQQNILQRAFLHPTQFLSDATDALSFTAGAIVSEYLTAGMASESILPKALRYMKGLGRGAEAAEATAQLTGAASKIGKGLVDGGRLTRQLATGAAYESAVEARQATMELREKLNSDWAESHPGEKMSDKDRAEIDDKLSDAGTFTYLANLALVGSSNMMQFPKIFGIGNKFAAQAEGKIIRDAETGAYKSTIKELGIGGKILAGLKNPAEEGLYEEGLQNVVHGTAVDYWSRKNDGKSKDNVDSFLNAFGKNLNETYTSKAGWNDIGMGMLIGGLGAPGRGALAVFGKDSKLGKYAYEDEHDEAGNKIGVKRREMWDGGILGGSEEHNAEMHEVAGIVDALNQHTSLSKAMKANYDFLIQNDNLEKDKEKALKVNDIFSFENAKDDQIHAYVSARVKAGLYEDMKDDINKMNQLSTDEFYASFRGSDAVNKVSDEEKVKFKQETVSEFLQKAENTKKAFEIVNDVYQGGNEDLREEMIHSVAASKNLDIREKAINKTLGKLSNGVIGIAEKPFTGRETKDNLVGQDTEVTKNGFTEVENSMLAMAKQVNPIEYTVNEKQIKKLLVDSRKIRAKRQYHISLFNTLFTEEGQKQFNEFHHEQAAKAVTEDVAKFKEAEEKEVKKRQEVVAKKVEKTEAKKANTVKAATEMTDEELMSAHMDESKINDKSPRTKELEAELVRRSEPDVNPTPKTNVSEVVAQHPEEDEDEIKLEVAKYEPEEETTPEEKAVATVVAQENTNQAEKQLKEDGLALPVPNLIDKNDNLGLVDEHKRSVGNTIISLNIDYAQDKSDKIHDLHDNEGNIKINKSFDSRLQDPSQFNTGSEVTMVVPTFDQIKAKGGSYTIDRYNDEIKHAHFMPIAFLDSKGDIIGYLPTVDNVRNRVKSIYVATELAKNMAIRDKIFANKDSVHKVTITGKSIGSLVANKNTKNIYDALGNGSKLSEGVSIGVVKDGRLQTSLGAVFTGKLANTKTLENGYVYAILPTAQEGVHVATYLDVQRVGEDKARTLLKGIQLFKANAKKDTDKGLVAERNELSNEVDLSNPVEFDKFVSSIIYKSADDDKYMFRTDNNKLILGTTPDMIFSRDQVMNDTDAQEKIVSILSQRYHAVQLSQFGKKFNEFNLKDNKLAITRHDNYTNYLNASGAVKTNIQGTTIKGTAKKYFTAQSVIEFSDPVLQNRENPAVTVGETNTNEASRKLAAIANGPMGTDNAEMSISELSKFGKTANEALDGFNEHYHQATDKAMADTNALAKEKGVTPLDLQDTPEYNQIYAEVDRLNKVSDYLGSILNSVTGNTSFDELAKDIQDRKQSIINRSQETAIPAVREPDTTTETTTEAPTDIVVEEPARTPVKANKLGIKYKAKNTPQINDDIEFINKLSSIKDLDAQAEELMKKCSG